MAEHEELLKALQEISQRIDESNHRLDAAEQYAADVEERTSERIRDMRKAVITKEHLRKRRQQSIAIALCITMIGLVLEHVTITKCFLSANQTGWSQSTCAFMFPGYNKARNQSRANLIQLQKIIEQVPQTQKDLSTLQERVKTLEEQP